MTGGATRAWTPCCVLLTALIRARPAGAIVGMASRPATYALSARARLLATAALRPRARGPAMSAEGSGGRQSAVMPFPETVDGVATFCAESARAKAPRKLLLAYTHALSSGPTAPVASASHGAEATGPTAQSAPASEVARADSSLEAVISALLKAERADLAASAHAAHADAHEGRPQPTAAWALATGRLVRALCRANDTPTAERVWALVNGARARIAGEPHDGAPSHEGGQAERPVAVSESIDTTAAATRLAELAAGSVPSLACAHLRAGNVPSALAHVRALPPHGPACAEKSYAEMLRWFGKAASFRGVVATLHALRNAGARPGAEVLDQLASAAVKRVDFVTGAVSMATLPKPVLPEVAFIGRSNVVRVCSVRPARRSPRRIRHSLRVACRELACARLAMVAVQAGTTPPRLTVHVCAIAVAHRGLTSRPLSPPPIHFP